MPPIWGPGLIRSSSVTTVQLGLIKIKSGGGGGSSSSTNAIDTYQYLFYSMQTTEYQYQMSISFRAE